jgi:hypothetical protein
MRDEHAVFFNFFNLSFTKLLKLLFLTKIDKTIMPTHPKQLTHTCHAGGFPEMVRTAGCSALVRGGHALKEHPEVVISGAFSFDYFSLGEQRKVIGVWGEIPKFNSYS